VLCPAALAQSVLVAPAGDDSATTTTLTRAVETALIERGPTLSVVTARSLGDELELDLVKACAGGDDGSCVAQFSEALGVNFVVRPSLSPVGDVVVLTLSLYDTTTGQVVAQGQRRAPRHKPELLLDQVTDLVIEVGQRGGLPVDAEVERPFPAGAVAMGVAGGVGLAIAGGGAALIAWQETRYQGAELDRQDAASWEQARWLAYPTVAVAFAGGLGLLWVGALTNSTEQD
jgi:hypothetical protein